VDKRGPHAIFKRGETAAKRGGQDLHPPRGAAEMQLIGHHQETAQIGQVHPLSLLQ
jgi:hypothetical protein